MSKKLLRIAAPVALGLAAPFAAPALGVTSALGKTALGAALGGAGGAVGGGGLKGALLGAVGGGAGSALSSSGILGKAAGTPLVGAQGPTQGSGLIGAITRNVGIGGGSSSFGNLAKTGSNILSGIQGTSATNKAERQLLEAQRQRLGAINPYAQTGLSANSALAQTLGLDPNADQESITNALRNTPSYQFQLEQGTQALDRSAAARGGLFSGAAAKALQQFGQGLADQTYNQRINDLQQQAAQGLGAAGMQSDIYDAQGNIRANSTVGKSNILNQTLSNLSNQGDEYIYDPTTGKMVKKYA